MGSHTKSITDANIHRIREFELEKVSLVEEFDILQIVGEGWFGKILLVEHKATDREMVLKALPKPYTALVDFYREFHYGLNLGLHKNIITAYDVAFETAGFYVFSQEYAPLGDLTSNVSEIGIGELHTKRVAKQLASALEYIHKKQLVHRDIKLDNILVFKSDFSRIKLCDFGETRPAGSLVLRRNEWLPYAAPEILEISVDDSYICNISHDIWQFGIVIFVCLTGCLPWQKAAHDDPRYVRYISWQNSTLPMIRVPKLFKLVSTKAQRFFKRYLEPKEERRPTDLKDVYRYLDDRWMSKGMEKSNETLTEDDGLCPSMYSFHSSPEEKNKILHSLTQYGLETTVDRNAKKDRIKKWIESSIIEEEEDGGEDVAPEKSNNAESRTEAIRNINAERQKRRRHYSKRLESREKQYKPPVDPRIPLEIQKIPQFNSRTIKTVPENSKDATNGPSRPPRNILCALPFRNITIAPSSPTTSTDSAISSDGSTIKYKGYNFLRQDKIAEVTDHVQNKLKFNANQLKFDKDYLNELTSDPNSGVFKQECKYHVALHPAQFNNFGESVKDELGKKIGRFDESFQGIMLGYENVRLQSKLGVIGSDNCHVHLDIEALFYVFHPQIDMVLKGTVTRTTKDHVGCLVYNTFNISLPKPAGEEDETWLGENVTIKSEVSFRITFVNLTARLPHIRGHLLSIESQGDISGVSLIKSEKKGKKTKFVDEEVVENPHKDKRKKMSSISVTEDPTEVEQEKPKKNKRRKSLSTSLIDESALYDDEVPIENGEVIPNKVKKHKEKQFRDYSSEAEVTTPNAKSEKKKRKKSTSFSLGESSLHTELILKDEIKEEEVSLTPSKYKDSDKTKKNKKKKSLSTSLIDESDLYVDEVRIENGEFLSNKVKKQKEKKFRDYSSEAEVDIPTAKSEKKNRKKSMSFSIGENSLHTELILKDEIKEEEVTLTPSKYKDSDKTKKKNKHRKKDDLDISLESLDIKSLFTENMDFDEKSSLNMADSPDKKRKRRKSQMISQDEDLYLDKVKLEPDSELEKIIGKKEKKSKS
ncbi:unnamed protein product [Ceutorhynchus assimilis]|uniref:Protein kinase domain-containing protein n=1 Tax=Ceutorhynchus assimilis TaxID=467358 RepID=A0A9N9MWJ1_9CUCU|nr:unnamed protein product [Ceutorhynchus assimilis]